MALPEHDILRYQYFLSCLQDQEMVNAIPYMLPFVKEVLLTRTGKNREDFINNLLEIFRTKIEALKNKKWFVGQIEILRLRVISDIVFQILLNKPENNNLNEELIETFLTNYCSFVLVIYNYKLEAEAEEMLKLVFKAVHLPNLETKIFVSVRESIKEAYQIFAKLAGQNK